MTKHYRYGSSTAARTMKCSAWRGMADEMPTPPASNAAMEGTAMHKLFELGLDDNEYPEDYQGKEVEGVAITAEHVNKVVAALEAHDTLAQEFGLTEIHTEATMEASDIVGGTGDVVGWSETENVVYIADLKTGDGVMVDADGNCQLLFVAALAIQHFKLYEWVNAETKFIMAIIQPSDRRTNYVDIWETDLETVNDFWHDFNASVAVSERGQPVPIAGSHCKFCPAQAVCPAKTGEASRALRLKPDSKERQILEMALTMVDEVEEWVKAVRKLAHEQMEQGVKLAGWKLVDKRAIRKWRDDAKVLEYLRGCGVPTDSLMTDPKLLSPAQVEKKFKSLDVDMPNLSDYIVKQSSGTTMAHDDDERKEAVSLKVLQSMAQKIKQ